MVDQGRKPREEFGWDIYTDTVKFVRQMCKIPDEYDFLNPEWDLRDGELRKEPSISELQDRSLRERKALEYAKKQLTAGRPIRPIVEMQKDSPHLSRTTKFYGEDRISYLPKTVNFGFPLYRVAISVSALSK